MNSLSASEFSPESKAYEAGANFSFDMKEESHVVASIAADKLREESGVKLDGPAIVITPEDHARGVSNVVGQFGKGMVEQVTERPLETAAWAAVGFAGAAALKALNTRFPVAGKVAGYGLLGLAGAQVLDAAPRWSKDISVAYDPSGLALSEVERAEKGIRGMGSGTVNLIAGGLLTPNGTRFAEAPKVAAKLDAYENSLRSMLNLPARVSATDHSGYVGVAPNVMAKLIRTNDGVADQSGYRGIVPNFVPWSEVVRPTRHLSMRPDGPDILERSFQKWSSVVEPATTLKAAESMVKSRVNEVVPSLVLRPFAEEGVTKYIAAAVDDVVSTRASKATRERLTLMLARNISPEEVEAITAVQLRATNPDELFADNSFMKRVMLRGETLSRDPLVRQPYRTAAEEEVLQRALFPKNTTTA